MFETIPINISKYPNFSRHIQFINVSDVFHLSSGYNSSLLAKNICIINTPYGNNTIRTASTKYIDELNTLISRDCEEQ